MLSVTVEVTKDDDGRPVVRKRSTSAAGHARLAREARALELARHPGVVEVLHAATDSDEQILVTLWTGSHTLATVGRSTVERAAGLAAALATVVADLHALGIVHGRITADHVVIGEGGRPILCGFGDASFAGAENGSTPADDVGGLGRLLHHLVGGDVEVEPIPDRRRAWTRRRPWSGYQRRALMTLADQSCANDPTVRPTARALAAAVLQAVPSARLPAPVAPAGSRQLVTPASGRAARLRSPSLRDRTRAPAVRRAALLVLATSVIVAVATAVHRGAPAGRDRSPAATPVADEQVRPRASPPGRTAPTTTTSPTTTTTTPASTTPATSVPGTTAPDPTGVPTVGPDIAPPDRPPPAPSPTCPATPDPVADVDGDGCAETVGLNGTTIVAGATRLTVGRPGDLVALGDWDCDGTVTAAVARPGSGEVFVFDSWARRDAPVTVTAVRTVESAAGIAATDDDVDGCDDLVVTGRDGRRNVVLSGSRP